jgi:alkaline phosphatase
VKLVPRRAGVDRDTDRRLPSRLKRRGHRSLALGVALIALVLAADAAIIVPNAGSRARPALRSAAPSGRPAEPGSSTHDSTSSEPDRSVTLVGAGDIASCSVRTDGATAKLIEAIPDAIVFTAGDDVYQSGTKAQYEDCYGPTWGRFLSRTYPALGNHDIATGAGAPYFAYFGPRAGTPGEGWYSFAAGAWNVIVLNGNCTVVGCGRGSPQLSWLRVDLATHPGCTLAIWHQPRFTSGVHGSDPRLVPLWEALYSAGADIVVNGHDHDYERFAPQTPFGQADPIGGIREFVVGTGGRSLRPFRRAPVANSATRNAATFGVLKLVLSPGSYSWQFLGVPGTTFRDSGTAVCNARRP